MSESEVSSLALIGFSEEISNEMVSLLDEHCSNTKVDYVENTKILEPFEVKFEREYDIIILNAMGYKTSVHEVISYVKIIYPLTEFVVVSFVKNFSLAIRSFRAGARDVIGYPINPTELQDSIHRAKSYLSVFKSSESLGNIIGMMSVLENYRQFRSREELFEKFQEYLEEKYLIDGFMVIQFDTKSEKMHELDNMKTWLAEDSEIYGLIAGFASEENHRRLGINWKQLPSYLLRVGFQLGVRDDQEFWCTFTVNEFIAQEISIKHIDYFLQFMRNAFDYQINIDKMDMMESLVHADDVTGLYNQRKLTIDLDDEIAKSKESGEPFSIIFLDIDDFKKINDGHGHIIGSLLLAELANVLKKVVRETDYLYRYGGDEFVIIFPEASSENVKPIAGRLLKAVQKQSFLRSSHKVDIKLSISIGVAEYPGDAHNRVDIIKMADKMMYEAKKAGKGQICMARNFLTEEQKQILNEFDHGR